MPLYHFDSGTRQTPVPHGDHWSRFLAFHGSDLHQAFEREVRRILEQTPIGKTIDSRHETKRVLTELQQTTPQLFIDWNEELGGLFGMTMWNTIARQPEDWNCHFIEETQGEFRGVWYWREH